MRLALLASLLISQVTYAVTCKDVEYPVELTVTVSANAGQENNRKIQVRGPLSLAGNDLSAILIWVSDNKDTIESDLIIPLHFEAQDDFAIAEFFAKEDWLWIEITAHYGKEVCDPQLEAVVWH